MSLDTFALVTTQPNSQVAPIHDRMFAIVQPDACELWLSDSGDAADLREALGPWTADPLQCWQVDRKHLNEADDERCIAPV